MFAVSWAIVYN